METSDARKRREEAAPVETADMETPKGHRYDVVDGNGGPWLVETTDEFPEPTPIGRVAEILASAARADRCLACTPSGHGCDTPGCPSYEAHGLAAHPAPEDGETVEALEACREQRGDLLALLEVEREQHAEALVRAWHEGYGAGSSDATDGWLHPGSPRRECPYPTPAPVADQQPTEGEKCRDCGPGYRIGSEGCRHTAPTSGTEGPTESDTPTADMSHNPPITDTETGR